MKYLWLGMYTPKEILSELATTGYAPMSITVAQESLVRGLKQYTPVDTISGGRYPDIRHGGKPYFSGTQWRDCDGSNNIIIDAVNLRYFEVLYKFFSMDFAARKWLDTVGNEQITVFIYGLHSPYIKCAKLIKKLHPNTQTIAIVPDLPEYYDFNMSKLKTMLKMIDVHNIRSELQGVDKFVLFTEQMSGYLGIEDKEHIVMEGSISTDSVLTEREHAQTNNNKVIIMYSGVIGVGYGLETMLEAFDLIKDPNYQLWMAGAGNLVPLVESYASKDPRITFFGFINDRQKLLHMQQQATMLICLLPPDNPAAQYCFPSKLFEYMASGNPTLSFYLPGIPAEYKEHLVEIAQNSPQGIADAIKRTADMSEQERYTLGGGARDFIINNKSNTIQSKRMLDFANKGLPE